jgi:hypothetical protein
MPSRELICRSKFPSGEKQGPQQQQQQKARSFGKLDSSFGARRALLFFQSFFSILFSFSNRIIVLLKKK